MSFGESVLMTTSEVSFVDKACRSLFLQCLKQLPFGSLTILLVETPQTKLKEILKPTTI